MVPIANRAEEVDMEDLGAGGSSPPVEEMAPPSTPTTESSSEVAPEAMEEATFDDVSYE